MPINPVHNSFPIPCLRPENAFQAHDRSTIKLRGVYRYIIVNYLKSLLINSNVPAMQRASLAGYFLAIDNRHANSRELFTKSIRFEGIS